MKKYLVTAFIFTLINYSIAQHVCGTDLHHQNLLKKHPELQQIEAKSNLEAKKNHVTKRAAKYQIPVVFHVIHTGGPENISREQILDQMRILNEDFSFTNANKKNIRSAFTSRVGSADIEFVLAKTDINGKCFDGVNRIYSTLGVDMDQNDEPVKDLAYWNYRSYLNIWVVTNIVSTGSAGTILGYAVFPTFAAFAKDGIVIRHDRVGSIGTASTTNDGRTLTHEMGHWLGLYHTFQGGCFDGDQVDDTPPVDGTFTNANCPANGNSCSNDNPNLLDMWENYMDYSNGDCMSAFTLNQISRMHYFLSVTPRSNNITSNNLVTTGITRQNVAPVAEFTSSHKVVCAGQAVKFYEMTCKGLPTVYSWSFPGSATPSSTDMNPSVIYQTPGKYQVSLTVQNGYGTDVETKTAYLEVLPAISTGYPSFEEGFENGDPTVVSGFSHLSPSTTRFAVTDKAAYTGSNSYVAKITTNSSPGAVYSFTTKSFNISELPSSVSPRFTFYCSYIQPNVNLAETLRVFISTDCGGTFNKIYERSGSALAYTTSANYTNNFVPSAKTQWKRHGLASLVSLGYGGAKNAIFRIDVLSDGGNPVYIDNINMSQWYAGINTLDEQVCNVNLFPNPTNNKATLILESNELMPNSTIDLYDLSGRLVKNIYCGQMDKGKNEFEISHPQNEQFGLFVVKIATPKGILSRALIFAAE
jgi:PKD repeat protein